MEASTSFSLRRKQLIGLTGAIAGLLVVTAAFFYADVLALVVDLPIDAPASRLAFAFHWLLIPGATLLIGVWAASRRGFYRDAIDGSRTPANHGLEINLRYNHNTLEQTVLAAFAWAGLSIALPVGNLVLIPAMAGLFAIGRLTFWIGYLIYPTGRTFGMVLTILPTAGAFAWLVYSTFRS